MAGGPGGAGSKAWRQRGHLAPSVPGCPARACWHAALLALIERINGIGARWWVPVPGIGELKAARTLDWLHGSEQVLGLRVGLHVANPRAQLTPTTLAAVVPAATAIVPYEKFVLPAELDGRAGRYRAPHAKCLLMVTNDHEAIGAWLASKRRGVDGAQDLSSTQRSWRKEAERLLLWSILERKTALRCRRKMPAPTEASSPIRRPRGAARGITSAGRRCGGRSKGR